MVDETEGVEVNLDADDQTSANEQKNDPVEELSRQFEALKKDNEKRREAEAAANRRAADERAAAEQARQDAQLARSALTDRETETIESRISAAQSEAEAATQEFAVAAEAGDFKRQAEAQRKIARAEARLSNLESTKADLEYRKSAPQVERQPVPRAADPFEDHLRQFTPRTAEWMREHRDWVVDPGKGRRLASAHHVAVAAGMEPDTDEYFQHVEKTLGIGQTEVEVETPAPKSNGAGNGQQKSQRRASPMVAPVNGGGGAHSSGAGNSRNANTVVLSPGEARAATDGTLVWNKGNVDGKGEVLKEGDPRIGKPIGVNEYARRRMALEKGGYYDKTYSHG